MNKLYEHIVFLDKIVYQCARRSRSFLNAMMRQETHPEQDFTLERDSLSIIRRKRAINDLPREDHFDRTLIQIVHERSSSLSLFADNLESIRFSERGAFEFG